MSAHGCSVLDMLAQAAVPWLHSSCVAGAPSGRGGPIHHDSRGTARLTATAHLSAGVVPAVAQPCHEPAGPRRPAAAAGHPPTSGAGDGVLCAALEVLLLFVAQLYFTPRDRSCMLYAQRSCWTLACKRPEQHSSHARATRSSIWTVVCVIKSASGRREY
jgi:hypothetical protein